MAILASLPVPVPAQEPAHVQAPAQLQTPVRVPVPSRAPVEVDLQARSCDQVKREIAARSGAAGLRGHVLEIVAATAPLPADARVVGSCDGGARRVVQRGVALASPVPTATAASAAARAIESKMVRPPSPSPAPMARRAPAVAVAAEKPAPAAADAKPVPPARDAVTAPAPETARAPAPEAVPRAADAARDLQAARPRSDAPPAVLPEPLPHIAARAHAKPPRAAPPPAPMPAPVPAAPSVAAPVDPLSAIDAAVAGMRQAQIAFNAPSAMNTSDTAQVELLLSLDEAIETLKRDLQGSGSREGAQVAVAERMEARLTGANFRIVAVSPEEQVLASKGRTQWQWDVQPTVAGTFPLHLTLTAVFRVDGSPARRTVRTFDRHIVVEVTLAQQAQDFFTRNWQWLWAVVLAPLVGWAWRKRQSAGVAPGPLRAVKL